MSSLLFYCWCVSFFFFGGTTDGPSWRCSPHQHHNGVMYEYINMCVRICIYTCFTSSDWRKKLAASRVTQGKLMLDVEKKKGKERSGKKCMN